MKLYYKSGACSLSPHIVALEAGLDLQIEAVDMSVANVRSTESGKDYYAIAEKGAIPALELDNGQILTEGVAIVQYLADLKPEANLAPKNGTFERVRLQEALNYIATEIHKGIGILFRSEALGPQAATYLRDMLPKKFDYLSKQLEGKKYLLGDQFTVADAYLFTVLNWTAPTKIDLKPWPNLVAYQARVAARPAVQAAMKAEGLLEAKAA